MAVAALGQLNVEEPPPAWGSRSVDCFERLEQIGEGTYGYSFYGKGFVKRVVEYGDGSGGTRPTLRGGATAGVGFS
ncbi:hypothetical protein Patl1_27218 [Pistacia atlantica]|uniref:Uncharacterized protein n=1 Tax=Pistacia atlantica TaxID=434234 RepID=A0ACC1BE86_9ROSI|nr:hypothetical protein Patl1_27218 [Pistacia atlantica]